MTWSSAIVLVVLIVCAREVLLRLIAQDDEPAPHCCKCEQYSRKCDAMESGVKFAEGKK